MNCPRCHSSQIRKFDHQAEKQRFKCNEWGRIWRASSTQEGYSPKVQQLGIKMHSNGMEHLKNQFFGVTDEYSKQQY